MRISAFPKARNRQPGLSLVELMVAMAIGLIILLVLTMVFSNTSHSLRNLQKSGEQIENGRYAVALLTDEIHHAGFFGQFQPPAAGTTPPDPCLEPVPAHLNFPVQVYSASLTSKAATPSCLDANQVSVGSDILVVRRADTLVLPVGAVASANHKYIQTNPREAQIQQGAGAAISASSQANGTTSATVLEKTGNAAPIRRLHVAMYFVSPCSQANCANGGDGIPTLKRMEMSMNGSTPVWTIVPLVSGIEFMQFDLGVDSSPGTPHVSTGLRGDGAADSYVGALVSGTNWDDVVSIKAYALSRTLETVSGHNDAGKSYDLGSAGTINGAGTYKRRLLTAEIRLNNVAGRRERILGEGV